MSGFPFGIGSSLLAPAGAVLSDGPAARRLRGSPSLSLALSGSFHLLLLGLFLASQARDPGAEPPKIEIRVWPQPPPSILTADLRLPGDARSPAPPSEKGVFTPRAERLSELDLSGLPAFPVDGPIVSGGQPGPAGGADRTGDGSAAGILLDDVGGETPSAYEEPPEARHAPEPEYPPLARGAGIEGRVVIEALVTRDGKVRKVRTREGDPILAEAASKAIRTWKFRPAFWNGKPVAAWVAVPVVFRLD
ncbi:MAG TPA: energy transducer TonB [Acidobacteriota bacterium]|nr:energy transducer TonB [Acidobacteriota bacterium]